MGRRGPKAGQGHKFSREKVLEYIKNHPNWNFKEMACHFGASESGAFAAVKTMGLLDAQVAACSEPLRCLLEREPKTTIGEAVETLGFAEVILRYASRGLGLRFGPSRHHQIPLDGDLGNETLEEEMQLPIAEIHGEEDKRRVEWVELPESAYVVLGLLEKNVGKWFTMDELRVEAEGVMSPYEVMTALSGLKRAGVLKHLTFRSRGEVAARVEYSFADEEIERL